MTTLSSRFRRLGAGVLAGALLAGACGGGDDDSSSVTVDPSTTTTGDTTTTDETTTSESTTTTEDPRIAEVEQAFFDQWDAYVEIVAAPDPANPLIDEYFSGAARDAVIGGISTLIAEGNAIRLPDDESNFEPRIVAVDLKSDTKAVVYECTIEGLVIFNRASGEIVDDAVSDFESRTQFEMVGDNYVVTDVRDPEPGEPGCDDL